MGRQFKFAVTLLLAFVFVSPNGWSEERKPKTIYPYAKNLTAASMTRLSYASAVNEIKTDIAGDTLQRFSNTFDWFKVKEKVEERYRSK